MRKNELYLMWLTGLLNCNHGLISGFFHHPVDVDEIPGRALVFHIAGYGEQKSKKECSALMGGLNDSIFTFKGRVADAINEKNQDLIKVKERLEFLEVNAQKFVNDCMCQCNHLKNEVSKLALNQNVSVYNGNVVAWQRSELDRQARHNEYNHLWAKFDTEEKKYFMEKSKILREYNKLEEVILIYQQIYSLNLKIKHIEYIPNLAKYRIFLNLL